VIVYKVIMGGSGGTTSSSIENTFNMSAVNQSIYNEINKTATTTTASGTNIQDLTLNIMNLDGCSVQTGQKITAKTMSSSEFNDTKTTNIKNAITNELQAAASSALEQNSQMGSELGALVSGDSNMEIKTEVNMEIMNLVENTITNETLNSTVAEQVNIQGQTLNVGNCVDSDISLNQDIVAEVAATSITKMMSDAIAGNTLLNTMAATADSSATKSQGGIAEIADSVFGGIAGIIGTSQEGAQVASAASVCCVCVLVLGGVAVALSPAGQNAGRAAASKF
jgi:hypothetical protein